MNEEEMLEKEKEESGQNFDSDVLASMVNTGENQTGMITIKKEEKENEKEEPLFTEVKEENKIKTGKIKKKLGKYVEKMLFDMKKNPEKYMLETPRGMMTIEEALQQGYDPATKDFTDKGSKAEFEESLAALSESGRESIKRITSPENMQMPESMAAGLGIDETNPMVAGNMQEQTLGQPEEAGQEVSPEILAALGGGQ